MNSPLMPNASGVLPATKAASLPLTKPRALVAAWPLAIPIEAKIVMLALCFRLVGAGVGFLANVTIPDYQNQGFTVMEQPNPFWDRFARFDAGWYQGIAAKGYRFVEGHQNNLAFFPAYPKLMGVLGAALGGTQPDFYFAGILISWVSFSAAMMLLYRLARLDLPHDGALRTTIYATVFPSAYFFGVVYSEAMFLLTLVAAAVALRKRAWVCAALAAAVMTATRVNGVMFLPALALIAWDSSDATRDRARGIAAVAFGLAGIGAYSLYVYTISGDALEWYYSITRWGYHPGGNPLLGLWKIGQALASRPMQFLTTERMAPYDTLNAVMAAAALLAVPFVWRRFGRGYAAIIVLGLILPLSSGQYEGLGRYCSVLFPLPMLLGSMQGEARHVAIITGSVMFYTLGLVLFGNVHPLF